MIIYILFKYIFLISQHKQCFYLYIEKLELLYYSTFKTEKYILKQLVLPNLEKLISDILLEQIL